MKGLRLLILLAVIFLLPAACSKQDVPLSFDNSDALAYAPNVQWAVVTLPYTACYQSVDYGSPVTTHYRRGKVLLVSGRQTAREGDRYETWFYFEEGWLPQSAVQLFSNKLRAQRYASELLSQ